MAVGDSGMTVDLGIFTCSGVAGVAGVVSTPFIIIVADPGSPSTYRSRVLGKRKEQPTVITSNNQPDIVNLS